MPSALSRVLLIGPSNIGDAILASDVLAALAGAFPDAHVTLVAGQRAAALFHDDPRIDSLVNTDAFDSAAGRLRLALALWRYHPHVVVDLRHTLYPLLLKPLQSWRYLRRPPRALAHMRERHRWQLRAQAPQAAGALERLANESLWCSEKDAAHVEQLLARWRLGPAARYAVICPGARSHIKRWLAQGFAEVADRLIETEGMQVVFSGETEERAVVDEVLKSMRHPAHSALGLTTIRQAGLLMRRARLVITNDSASLHLASALGVPTLALFGPTDPAKYGPTAPASRTVRRRLFCSPCEQAQCRFHHECMRFIGAEEVYQAARRLLQAP